MVTVRAAVKEEAEFFSELALSSKSYWGYDEQFIEACREALTVSEEYINQHHVYVAEVEGTKVGIFSFIHEGGWQLDLLYIDPVHIGKGYGRELWNSLISIAKSLGIQSFTIDSDPHAKEFYEKMGAVQIGETPSTVFKDRNLPLMQVTIHAK
ncbi:GNAT family N-acetyltransferase [Thalassobacillus hwangdonensis]|uniref:GNAT family N-acetyltransferase n=1 Tax=Thalassobacillus hwangdonensis TaxID=546108 RepID=A0ABW3L328_9BACI